MPYTESRLIRLARAYATLHGPQGARAQEGRRLKAHFIAP
ncbi:hypothetical protein FX982_00195 [Pseudomonas graminis]|uniref:Uncharacterized protein n=1 Tax=Pseudomonas graminis TaxID=158627 RepID=A0A6M8MQD2_9PSED|nr:hypothetical protein FX982_00195 [Pseudomonas graminis]